MLIAPVGQFASQGLQAIVCKHSINAVPPGFILSAAGIPGAFLSSSLLGTPVYIIPSCIVVYLLLFGCVVQFEFPYSSCAARTVVFAAFQNGKCVDMACAACAAFLGAYMSACRSRGNACNASFLHCYGGFLYTGDIAGGPARAVIEL